MSNTKQQFEYQLSFRLMPGDTFDFENSPSIQLPKTGARLTCRNSRVTIAKELLETREQAESEVRRLRRAVLLWALERKLPVEMQFNTHETNGVIVAESSPKVRLSINATGNIKLNGEKAAADIEKWYEDDLEISDKEELAIELFCSSQLNTQPNSQFVILVTAVEALIDREQRSDEALKLIDVFKEEIRNTGLDPRERDSLVGSLQDLRLESIKRAGLRLAQSLETEYKVGPGRKLNADDFFSKCYDLRSEIVHANSMEPEDKEMAKFIIDSGELCRFVSDLLLGLVKNRKA